MPDASPASSRASNACEFFTAYFKALATAKLPHVILHGYAEYPHRIGSDVDYAVLDGDLSKATKILLDTCALHDWGIAQEIRYTAYGRTFIAYNRQSITETINLDVCSHFGHGFALLLKDTELLESRGTCSGLPIPAPRAEFAYVLAKALCKGKSLHEVAPRLHELADSDRTGCARAFARLTGLPAGEVDAVCHGTVDSVHWSQMRRHILRRHSGSPLFLWKEGLRRISRFLHPSGLVVGLLGVDGSGKSTLMHGLTSALQPFFRQHHAIHFQPGFFTTRQGGTVERPHAQPPRSKPVSWLKVLYYYADWLLGYFGDLRLRTTRSTLVISDRTLDDLIIDPKRYRTKSSSWLANLLRGCLPTPDLILVMIGPAQSIHARKPELQVEEIARQQDMLRGLAATDHRMHIVDAGREPEQVVEAAARIVLKLMVDRCAKRRTM